MPTGRNTYERMRPILLNVEGIRFSDGTYLLLKSECLNENHIKVPETGNITINDIIERKMTIRKVFHSKSVLS